jgi:hypothetical protein
MKSFWLRIMGLTQYLILEEDRRGLLLKRETKLYGKQTTEHGAELISIRIRGVVGANTSRYFLGL